MKILRILPVIFALIAIIAVPVSAFAAEDQTLPDPGITPDSPFYFADKWMKQIGLAFTFGEDAKVQKSLEYAQERLAEINAMAAQNKLQAMEKAAEEYQYCLGVATQHMERALVNGEDTTGQVAVMMSNNISIMNQFQSACDEDCQQILQQTRNKSQECQETAVRTLAGQDAEKAIQLNLNLMEQECTRLTSCIGQSESAGTEDAYQQYERLMKMNQEMIANAEQQGTGSQLQQMVEQASAIQEKVSVQLQTRNEDGDETMLQNQVKEQQQVKTSLNTGEQTTSNSVGLSSGSGSDENGVGTGGNNADETGNTGDENMNGNILSTSNTEGNGSGVSNGDK